MINDWKEALPEAVVYVYDNNSSGRAVEITKATGAIVRYEQTFPVLSKGFEIETEMSIHAVNKNMRVENVIIDYRDRPEGRESKLNTYSDGIIIYLKTVLVPNFPTLIVSGFVALAAIQSFFAGLILTTIVEKERQNFEFKLQMVNLSHREDDMTDKS